MAAMHYDQVIFLITEPVRKLIVFLPFAVYEETAGLMVNDPVLRTHKVTLLHLTFIYVLYFSSWQVIKINASSVR